MIGIYILKNLRTQKIYIGSSSDIEERVKSHFYLLRASKHPNRDLQQEFNNGDTICLHWFIQTSTTVLAVELEQNLIEKYQCRSYNKNKFPDYLLIIHKCNLNQVLIYINQRKTIDQNNGCWYWNGTIKNGYGIIYVNKKKYSLHRFIWVLENQKNVPRGLLLRHTCDNRNCFNPQHLIIGTEKDNALDRINARKHLIPLVKNLIDKGYNTTNIARELKLNIALVRKICNENKFILRKWKNKSGKLIKSKYKTTNKPIIRYGDESLPNILNLENYQKLNAVQIAKKLNIPVSLVRRLCRKYNLKIKKWQQLP